MLPTMWTKDEESITSSNPDDNPCNCILTLNYNNRTIKIDLVINVTSVRDYGVYTCIKTTDQRDEGVITTIVACLQSEF